MLAGSSELRITLQSDEVEGVSEAEPSIGISVKAVEGTTRGAVVGG